MTTVKIEERKIWVDDTAIPLISGEVHYWRLDPHSWRDILNRVREMGLNIVATYVCWDFHEIAPGEYDFHGKTDPRRNLLAFLELLTEEGFWIILRPGPYIYSEWSNNGVPDHAAQYHRLHPKFLTLAEHYMQDVYQAVEAHLATRGGRIIVWQSDNEIDPWAHLYTEQLGLGTQVGIFHEYLQKKYALIEALNQAWNSQFSDFEAVRAVSNMRPNDSILMGRYNDFRSFLHWYVEKVATWGVETYRTLGVDVPFLLNTYSGVGTQHWSNLEQIADIVGPDIYPSREFLHRGGNKEHRTVLEASRYTDAYSRLPYIPEYQAGIWHDWLEDVGFLPPNHYRLLCISAMMGGVVGWNWYMLVNRDNWYQSPINEWGRTRPELFDVFKQMTHLFNDIDAPSLKRLANIALTFDPLQRATDRPGQDLLQSFYDADIDYDFWDLSRDVTDHPIAFYAGGHWLSADGQQKMLDYVENGGHLIFVGDYPRMDEHLQALNMLNIQAPDGIISAAPFEIPLESNNSYFASQWLYNYQTTAGTPIIVKRLPVEKFGSEELGLQFNLQTGSEYTIGYTEKRGKGKITVYGLKPSSTVILALLNQNDISPPSQSLTSDITSAVLQSDDAYYLMLANLGNESKVAQIQLSQELIDESELELYNCLAQKSEITNISSSGLLTTPIDRKDGAVYRIRLK